VTASASYAFRTLDDPADVTFNQLLGINNRGVIAGYFGSGAAGHPNKGYLLRPPYGSRSQYQNIRTAPPTGGAVRPVLASRAGPPRDAAGPSRVTPARSPAYPDRADCQ
jgi:hypothetical protein